MSREKILQGLKDLSQLADKEEVSLCEVGDKLNDLLIEVEDFIDDCKRKAAKQEPKIPKGKL